MSSKRLTAKQKRFLAQVAAGDDMMPAGGSVRAVQAARAWLKQASELAQVGFLTIDRTGTNQRAVLTEHGKAAT